MLQLVQWTSRSTQCEKTEPRHYDLLLDSAASKSISVITFMDCIMLQLVQWTTRSTQCQRTESRHYVLLLNSAASKGVEFDNFQRWYNVTACSMDY